MAGHWNLKKRIFCADKRVTDQQRSAFVAGGAYYFPPQVEKGALEPYASLTTHIHPLPIEGGPHQLDISCGQQDSKLTVIRTLITRGLDMTKHIAPSAISNNCCPPMVDSPDPYNGDIYRVPFTAHIKNTAAPENADHMKRLRQVWPGHGGRKWRARQRDRYKALALEDQGKQCFNAFFDDDVKRTCKSQFNLTILECKGCKCTHPYLPKPNTTNSSNELMYELVYSSAQHVLLEDSTFCKPWFAFADSFSRTMLSFARKQVSEDKARRCTEQ